MITPLSNYVGGVPAKRIIYLEDSNATPNPGASKVREMTIAKENNPTKKSLHQDRLSSALLLRDNSSRSATIY